MGFLSDRMSGQDGDESGWFHRDNTQEHQAMKITTEAEYDAAMQRINTLWNPPPEHEAEFMALVLAVEEYETVHHPVLSGKPGGA